jgi:hypothetical protein
MVGSLIGLTVHQTQAGSSPGDPESAGFLVVQSAVDAGQQLSAADVRAASSTELPVDGYVVPAGDIEEVKVMLAATPLRPGHVLTVDDLAAPFTDSTSSTGSVTIGSSAVPADVRLRCPGDRPTRGHSQCSGDRDRPGDPPRRDHHGA